MGKRRFIQERCGGCGLHLELCLCAVMPQVDLGFPVSVLQHNGERGKPTSTGEMVSKLFAGSSIHRYGVRDVPFDSSPYEGGVSFLLLYPSEDSLPLTAETMDGVEDGSRGLLLLDGTWAQSSHMRSRLPCIKRLPCFHIVPTDPAIWTLRKTKEDDHRCTLETAIIATEAVCGRKKVAPVWEFFQKLTASLLFMRGDIASPEPPRAWRRQPEAGRVLAAYLPLIALLLMALGSCGGSDDSGPEVPTESAVARYVGSDRCRSCHADQFKKWSAGHHALAEVPFDEATHGAAFLQGAEWDGGGEKTRLAQAAGQSSLDRLLSDGSIDARRPTRVIGVAPLWQVLVSGEGGRLQASAAAYDEEAHEWFDVFGGDGRAATEWGHWTQRGMTWNSMCATCHVTDFRKNYSIETDSYASTYSEARVGCEACHGPMSLHVENAEGSQEQGRSLPIGSYWAPPVELKQKASTPGKWDVPAETLPDTTDAACAMCHARRVELATGFEAGQPFLNHFSMVLPDATDIFYPDGQIREEDYEYASFAGSRMHAAGVRCNHCHEPHGSGLRMEGNALCLSCHHETINPEVHTHHSLGSPGSNCIDCHMPTTVYMQRDGRHDHSFSIPVPELTIELGIPNACNRCHGEKDAAWSVKALDEWFPDRPERPAVRRARALHAVRELNPGSHALVARALKDEALPYWRAVLTGVLSRTDEPVLAIPLLLQGMASEDPLRRWAAAQNAGELINEAGDEASIAAGLRKLLEDPVRAVRVAAAWGLRRSIDQEHSAAVELMEFLLLNADQPAGALQLGTWFFDRGQGDRVQLKVALGWIEKAANWDAGSAVALHGCAVVKSALGDSKGARKLLERAVKLQPENVPWLYGLSLAVYEDGDLARAERLLVKVCRLAPDHLRARYNLALAQVALGRVDDGLKSMGEAIRRAPRNLDFLMARVAILRDAGRIPDALARMREVVGFYPQNRDLLGVLREFLLATGDKRGAAEIERRLSRLP